MNTDAMKNKLAINVSQLSEINSILTSDNWISDQLINLVEKHGGVDAINAKHKEALKIETQLNKLKEMNSPYLKDIKWLMNMVETKAFVSIEDYRKKVLGNKFSATAFNESSAVTLEISATNFFTWLIDQAKHCIENKEIMPGRYIRVRNMKESEADEGDLIAFSSAMNIIGATWVETLDAKGTDGSNVHLGGPATITGYFGGPGQPNDYPIKWAEEFLYYYMNYGTKQVLNLNPGTILVGYMLHKLGIDIEFKISVFMGNDNAYSVFWTLMTAKLFARADGSTPLIGFNFSNSVDNATILRCSRMRRELGFEKNVRFEHHITEAYKSIVRQPYDRAGELVELAKEVKNISAKHEGGIPATEEGREHPSDILDYFVPKIDILKNNLMTRMAQNYMDKHAAVNRTAKILTQNGLSFVAASNLHQA